MRQSLPELREECRRTKANADPADATARRLRAARCLRRITDGEGAYNLRLKTTPEDGAKVDAAPAPVAVSTIQAMLTDAFLALVVTDGVDVFTVAHAGRQVTAHQRTALEARGFRCEVPGCGARHNLEIDHIEDWSLTLRTALGHLGWLCKHHHSLKTHSGYRLTRRVGARVWRGPDGEPVANAPPDHLFDVAT